MESLRAVIVVCFSALMGTAAAQVPQQGSPGIESDAKAQARTELNRGVDAFKGGRYDEAASAFQRAKKLDPQLLNARLYLATTYASQYIPGAPSEENLRNGKQSVEEFRGVLTLDPGNLSAIDGIGSILFQMAGTPYKPEMFLESKSFHKRHIQLKPEDPEPYYWVGVIDWTAAFRANSSIRQKYNLEHFAARIKDNEPLPEHLRLPYVREYGLMIDEGIEFLQKAIALRPDYDDAMAYLNLLYRRKADIVASETERAQLLKIADGLIDQVMEIKQKRATQNQ
jgi:tetratricopeptide (TPR) repeat protein